MKSSFSLLETIIATLLLSITITALLKMKENNLYFLSSTTDRNKLNGYISIQNVSTNKNNENIDFKEYISLNNDELRRELKDLRLEYKRVLNDKLTLELKDTRLDFNIYQETYSDDKLGKKSFYRVTLDE